MHAVCGTILKTTDIHTDPTEAISTRMLQHDLANESLNLARLCGKFPTAI